MGNEPKRTASRPARGGVSRRAFMGAGASALALAATPLRAAPPRPIRLALIGCDSEGIALARSALQAAPGVELAALADEVPARARRAFDVFAHPRRRDGVHPQFSARPDRVFGGPGSSRSVLDLEDIDAVLLAGIPAHRPRDLSQAVSNGRPAFLATGPCAVDAAGCAALLHAAGVAERRGIVVSAAVPSELLADRDVRARVEAGQIGDIVAADTAVQRAPWRRFVPGAGAEANWYYDEALSGGPVLTEGLSQILRMRSLLRGLPVSASGVERRDGRNPGTIASYYSIRYRYGDGREFSVSLTLDPAVPMARHARLMGTNGSVDLAPFARSSFQPGPLAAFLASLAAPWDEPFWRPDIAQLVAGTRVALLGREAARLGRTVRWTEIA